jgi:hypothetical protein
MKFTHILEGMNYLKVAGSDGVLPQVYFEFGCHSARTFSAAVNAGKYLGMSDLKLYAFDSFEGLPKTNVNEDGYFKSGMFCTSKTEFKKSLYQKTGVWIDDQYIVEGFYSESLTSEVQARMPKVGIVHIDVDLYSSTAEVLRFIKPLLVQGTLLMFDDWYCFPGGISKGERLALEEFLADNVGIKVEPWKAYSTFGQSFFVSKLFQNQNRCEKEGIT